MNESQIIEKLKELFIDEDIKLKAAQYPSGVYRPILMRRLTWEALIRHHLEGLFTITATSRSDSSKWFVIDIDDKDPLLVATCIQSLEKLISKEYIHISDSGSKGFHIELFFEERLSNRNLDFLIAWVRKESQSSKLEFFPRKNARCVKLPLGYNQKTGNFCCYLQDFKPVSDSYEHLLSIRPIPKEAIDKILKLDHDNQDSLIARPSSNQHNLKALPPPKELMDFGLKKQGTRHESTIYLAMYLNGQGWTKEVVKSWLQSWSLKQLEQGMSHSTPKEIKEDVNGIVEWVFSKGCKIQQGRGREGPFYITHNDYQFLTSFKRNSNSAQKVLLALLIQAKKYADPEEGSFFMSITSIMKATGLIKETVIRALKVLKDLGKVEIINKGNSIKKKANVYKLSVKLDYYNHGLLIKESLTLDEVVMFFREGSLDHDHHKDLFL